MIDIYIKGFSEYSRLQIENNASPGRNDAQDLMHLYYLENDFTLKLVSDDRIFRRCVPEHVISLNDLIGSNSM